jgi:hypothetical protein
MDVVEKVQGSRFKIEITLTRRTGGRREALAVHSTMDDGAHWACPACTFHNGAGGFVSGPLELHSIGVDVTDLADTDSHCREQHPSFLFLRSPSSLPLPPPPPLLRTLQTAHQVDSSRRSRTPLPNAHALCMSVCVCVSTHLKFWRIIRMSTSSRTSSR